MTKNTQKVTDTECQGGCGKVRSVLFTDSPADWLCNDCRVKTKLPKWLRDLFQFEYCSECYGDAEDHIPCAGPFGLPFAMCKFAPIIDGIGFRHGKVIEL